MVAVRVMETAVHKIVHMIAMGHRLVAATRSVDMAVGVADVFDTRAAAGVVRRYREHVLVHRSVLVLMMQVAVVEEIDMIVMTDRRVATSGAVLVLVVFLANVFRCHGFAL